MRFRLRECVGYGMRQRGKVEAGVHRQFGCGIELRVGESERKHDRVLGSGICRQSMSDWTDYQPSNGSVVKN